MNITIFPGKIQSEWWVFHGYVSLQEWKWKMAIFERYLLLEIHPFFTKNHDHERKGNVHCIAMLG